MSDWRTVGQRRHVVIEHRLDDEGEVFVKTACGLLIWPSRVDARLTAAPVCCQCSLLHGPG